MRDPAALARALADANRTYQGDLRVAELAVLLALHGSGGPMTGTTIGEATGMELSTVTRSVDALTAAGRRDERNPAFVSSSDEGPYENDLTEEGRAFATAFLSVLERDG